MKRFGLVLFAAALIGAMVGMTLPAGAQQTAAEYWGYSWHDMTVPNPTADDFNGTVDQVATSNSTWYAVTATGSVEAWGAGTHGQLGNGTKKNSPTPVTVEDLPPIAYMADTSPQATALAVATNGQVYGWGSNEYGQLCKNPTTPGNKKFETPIELPFTVATPITGAPIAGAGDHTLVVTGSGALEGCGGNGDGDLGNNGCTSQSCTPAYSPVTISLPAGATAPTSVYASWRNSATLTASGQLYSWGYNGLGEVGGGDSSTCGTTTCVTSPVSITPDPSAPVDDVALGGSGPANGQVLAIAGGQMYAWGSDAWSQLGDVVPTPVTCDVTDGSYAGSYPCVTSPEPSTLTTAKGASITPVTVKTGGQTSYAIDTSKTLYGWGDNSGDQIGETHDSQKTCKGQSANRAPGVDGHIPDHEVCLTPVQIASDISQVSTTLATVEDLSSST
jgi:alpha-tubulin suppressor-like RCC1 family protein